MRAIQCRDRDKIEYRVKWHCMWIAKRGVSMAQDKKAKRRNRANRTTGQGRIFARNGTVHVYSAESAHNTGSKGRYLYGAKVQNPHAVHMPAQKSRTPVCGLGGAKRV